MRLLVASDYHYSRGRDGHIFAQGPYNYAFWSRYLDVFDEIVILARVREDAEPQLSEARVDGPGVTFWPLPDFVGPWQYLRRLYALKAHVREAVRACDAYILRVPGLVGRLAWFEIKRLRRPYAVEVVGDPWDAFSPGSMHTVFRPLFRVVATHTLRAMCRQALAASYVTRQALQERFPPGKNTLATHYSSVELSGEFATPESLTRRIQLLQDLDGTRLLHLGFVGSFAQLYKGPDTLLHAASLCLGRGIDLEVLLVGDGCYRPAMERLARRLRVDKQVRFLGHLPYGPSIYEFLDTIDLLVMPSRQEGLPRAMLEAMARGCPCIGSRVGGTPELIPADELVTPDDPEALAAKIVGVVRDPQRMIQMAQRNLDKAKEYRKEILCQRRTAFYRYVRERTEETPKAQ